MTSHLVTRKIFLHLCLAMLGFIIPAIKQAEAQSGMQLNLAPTEADMYAGGVFHVEITVAGAETLCCP